MNNKYIATTVAACLAAIGAPSDWTLYDYSYGTDTRQTVDVFSIDRTGFATWNSETFYDDLGFPNYVGEGLEQQ